LNLIIKKGSMNKKITVILSLMFLFISSSVFAETIVLKSGRTVEAKILKKTDNSIKVDVEGIPITYYLNEVESIDGNRINIASSAKDSSSDNKSLSQSQNENPKAKAFFENGTKYFEQANYTEAIKEFTKAVEINPDNARIYVSIGMSYAGLGQTQLAIGNIQKARELLRRQGDYLGVDAMDESLAHLVSQKKEISIEGNISDYAKVIEADPQNGYAYVMRGRLYKKNGNFDNAISDYTKAIDINPKNVFAYNGRGLTYEEKGLYDQAILDFTKAIEISPIYSTAYGNRAYAYVLKGNLEQAIPDYNKLIEMKPTDSDVYIGRAYTYYLMKRYDKAWDDVHRAESLGYNNPTFINELKKASGRDK